LCVAQRDYAINSALSAEKVPKPRDTVQNFG
jgi:hypothetical protein